MVQPSLTTTIQIQQQLHIADTSYLIPTIPWTTVSFINKNPMQTKNKIRKKHSPWLEKLRTNKLRWEVCLHQSLWECFLSISLIKLGIFTSEIILLPRALLLDLLLALKLPFFLCSDKFPWKLSTADEIFLLLLNASDCIESSNSYDLILVNCNRESSLVLIFSSTKSLYTFAASTNSTQKEYIIATLTLQGFLKDKLKLIHTFTD